MQKKECVYIWDEQSCYAISKSALTLHVFIVFQRWQKKKKKEKKSMKLQTKPSKRGIKNESREACV